MLGAILFVAFIPKHIQPWLSLQLGITLFFQALAPLVTLSAALLGAAPRPGGHRRNTFVHFSSPQ